MCNIGGECGWRSRKTGSSGPKGPGRGRGWEGTTKSRRLSGFSSLFIVDVHRWRCRRRRRRRRRLSNVVFALLLLPNSVHLVFGKRWNRFKFNRNKLTAWVGFNFWPKNPNSAKTSFHFNWEKKSTVQLRRQLWKYAAWRLLVTLISIKFIFSPTPGDKLRSGISRIHSKHRQWF